MSSSDIDRCFKVQTDSYEYTRTFPVPRDGDDVFLKFYVKAEKHPHIILSPATEPSKRDDHAYEIVLGTWRGQKSTTIRKTRGDWINYKAMIYGGSALSATEWRFFWIRVSPDGYFQIGNKPGSRPFLVWKDDSFMPIKHIGLASWECPAEWALDWEL